MKKHSFMSKESNTFFIFSKISMKKVHFDDQGDYLPNLHPLKPPATRVLCYRIGQIERYNRYVARNEF